MSDVCMPWHSEPGPYRVVRWAKHEGEQVRRGEFLCLLVSATQRPVEIFAEDAGTVREIYAPERTALSSGDTLAELETTADRWERWGGVFAAAPSLFGFFATLGLALRQPSQAAYWAFAALMLSLALGGTFLMVWWGWRRRVPALAQWLLPVLVLTSLVAGAALLLGLLFGDNPAVFLGGFILPAILLSEYLTAREVRRHETRRDHGNGSTDNKGASDR